MTTDNNNPQNSLDLKDIDNVGAGAPATTDGQAPHPETTADSQLRMSRELEAIYDIPVQISAVLGKANMQVSQLLKLGRGAVVELDRKVGEAIDIFVNDRLVARGEVVIMEEKLGITMTEIIKLEKN